MKKLFAIIAASLLLAVPAFADDVTFGTVWSSAVTCTSAGPAGVYIGMGGTVSFPGKSARVDGFNATSDLAGSTVTFLTQDNTSYTTIAATSSGSNNLLVGTTAGFDASVAGAGDYVAILYRSTKKFEINRISSITTDTSLNLVNAVANTYPIGTVVYELQNLYSVPVGNATKAAEEATLYGEVGEVLGYVVNGTSSCSMNFIAGGYQDNY
jgi:hypothetical protein